MDPSELAACIYKQRRLRATLLVASCCHLVIGCLAFSSPKFLKLPNQRGCFSCSKIVSVVPSVVLSREERIRLDLFRRLFGGDDDSKKGKNDETEIQSGDLEIQKESSTPLTNPLSNKVPFFASIEAKKSESANEIAVEKAEPVAVLEKLTPQQEAVKKAEAMKREAARFRMEAERMDIVLSLDKISALEKKLEAAKKSRDEKFVQEVEGEIAVLRRKLDPSVQPPKPVPTKKADAAASTFGSNASIFSNSNRETLEDESESSRKLKEFLDKPSNKFMKDLIATSTKYSSNSTATIMEKLQAGETIEIDDLKEIKEIGEIMDELATEVEEKTMSNPFPKSMLKMDQFGEKTESLSPSEEDVVLFMNLVLSPSTFVPSAKKPRKYNVGYVIRGTNRLADGNKLIDAIDDALEKKSPYLKDRLSFYLVEDPASQTMDMELNEPNDAAQPMLLVTSVDILEGTNQRIGRLLATGLGLASTYLFSIFPFTFNEVINKRVETAISLGSQDLGFLTELTEPLFFTTLGIVAVHELGHLAVASIYKFKTSFPTLIPSPAIGLSSSITRLKTSPKNRQQLLDFALAGPWAGIVCSLISLFIGLQLTATMDAESFAKLPALPTSFLQSSTLISSIIDGVLDIGLLRAPDPTFPVPLHPAAIAGYMGLLFNTLNLIPYGSKFVKLLLRDSLSNACIAYCNNLLMFTC